LGLYARDWLIRARGPLPIPQEIRIVAIDEASLRRFGRFPWPRTVFARLIQNLSKARPTAILLDILFVDPSTADDDAKLASSIREAGNVISAAQLSRNEDGRVVWLRPLPELEKGSAATGHVEVSTEVSGVAESFLTLKADDEGASYWAMPIEAIQIGERTTAHSLETIPGAVRFGTHTFPVQTDNRTIELTSGRLRSMKRLQGGWISIEYAGPPGRFSTTTFSAADVIEGKVPPSTFRDKYVIVGATAARVGGGFNSPFVHSSGSFGEQHGEQMSGTEVLANALNTLLRDRAYSDTPDSIAALVAVLVGILTMALLSLTQGKHEAMTQGLVLLCIPAGILGVGYWIFSQWLVYPPLVPALVSFVACAPLTLLQRNLEASRQLDDRIRELVESQRPLLKEEPETSWNAAMEICAISRARFAAILLKTRRSEYRLVCSSMLPTEPEEPVKLSDRDFLGEPVQQESPRTQRVPKLLRRFEGFTREEAETTPGVTWLVPGPSGMEGILFLVPKPGVPIPLHRARLTLEMAGSYLVALEGGRGRGGVFQHEARPRGSRFLPRGLEWKTLALAKLQRTLLREAQFTLRSLRSVGDGLLVAVPTGEIVFANLRASEIFGVPEQVLIGSSLFERLGMNESQEMATLEALLVDRILVEREVHWGSGKPRFFSLRMNVATERPEERGSVLGIVATISDITKQQELQQLKSDVLSLVTHEMRTPLTAIQGMSEVLAEFELEVGRRKEMHLAINEEAKRLARMIEEYLDIARLEAGARPLRKESLRLEKVVDRVLLLLEPVANRRGIFMEREMSPSVPNVLADEDLLSRAVTNVVGNAIKFSAPGDVIRIGVRAEGEQAVVAIEDTGPGIGETDLPHIFEKFYRVPRAGAQVQSGSGLGLAYVKEIMEAHGGCVTVESKIGAGSKFLLRLPRLNLPLQAD
jgi:PAS domain S-box-containing protein